MSVEAMEGALRKVVQAIPVDTEQGRTAADRLSKEFRDVFDSPPLDELEAMLRERFTVDRARKLMFTPESEDMSGLSQVRWYVLLVQSPPDGAPREHPQHKLQKLFLTLLYLVHVNTPKVSYEFVVNGGLLALAGLVDHQDFSVRAQALETFMALTASEYLDWFKNPPEERQRKIHPHLIQLAQTTFLGDLIKNYEQSFPSGSFLALQIIAFFLSWVRLFYCKDNVIRVSRDILKTFKAWSQRTDLSKDETDFAKKLWDDFGRHPADDGSVALASQNEFTNTDTGKQGKVEIVELAEESPTPAKEEETLSLKAQGNACFARGEYAEAQALYTKAIELGEERDFAKLYGNKAAAHMELSKAGSKEEHLVNCITACRSAIEHDENYVKAYYRLAQAQIESSMYEEARVTIDKALSLSIEHSEREAFEELTRTLNFRSLDSPERKEELYAIYRAILRRFGEDDDDVPRTVSVTKPVVEKEVSRKEPVQPPVAPVPKASKPVTNKSKKKKKKPKLTELKQKSGEELAEVLSGFDATQFRSTLGDNLDDELFCNIVACVDSLLPARAKDALGILENLAKVNRFSMITMFTPETAKVKLVSIFTILSSMLAQESGNVAALQKKYSV